MTRDKIIEVASSYLGAKQGDGRHIQIIAVYNSIYPLPRGYKMTLTDSWCAAFVSAIFSICGAKAEDFPFECSCIKMIDGAKANGMWVEKDTYVPQIGDLLLYAWQDSGNYATTDCLLAPNHIGIVSKISGENMTIIEGNYGKACKERSMKINGRYIRGYITPKYDIVAKDAPSAWAKDAWETAVTNGIFDGTNPGGAVTREQLAVVLDRLRLL